MRIRLIGPLLGFGGFWRMGISFESILKPLGCSLGFLRLEGFLRNLGSWMGRVCGFCCLGRALLFFCWVF